MVKITKSIYGLPKFFDRKGAIQLMLFFMAFLLYANTLGHQFTQDDAIVIYDNIYVKEGVKGIPDIFNKDSFSGFFNGEDKSSLVSGGRYRPLTIAVFACIYQIAGTSPFIYHLFNVLMYALLGIVLYTVITAMNVTWSAVKLRYFALVATIIFLAHPVHTEVIANVKGLDEVFSLLFSLVALYFGLRYIREEKIGYGILLGLGFFIALLSKENAAAFLIVIPVVLFYFTQNKSRKSFAKACGILVITFLGYWFLRMHVIGTGFGDPPAEMMNNPFIKVADGQYVPFTVQEKWASIIYGMGKYIQLLFFPHPLTHDYYPRHFEIVSLGHLSVLAAIVMNAALAVIALLGIRKRSFISFCIFFFYTTIALMCNVIFPIGTHLSERFLFTPSVAFALFIAFCLVRLRALNQYRSFVPVSLTLIIILSSAKTVWRNNAWKDDLTLFTTDVQISKNSAKVRNAAGGALLSASMEESNEAQKNMMISEAIVHLSKAIDIHPNYKEAHLLSGNAYSYLKDYDQSIRSYDQALRINPNYDLATDNLLIVLREGAREAGAVRQDYAKAIGYLQRALKIDPDDYESTALMGTAYGSSGAHHQAIIYFERAISIKPDVATTYVNLGYAQLNIGLEEDAQINFNKAVQIDPKALDMIQ